MPKKRKFRRITGFSLSSPVGGFGLQWEPDPRSPVDLGDHTGTMRYEEGSEEDVCLDYSAKVKVNRLRSFESRTSTRESARLGFARIVLNHEMSLWFEIADLHNDSVHMPRDFKDPDFGQLYELPKYCFHQNTRWEGDRRENNPVLDIVLLNSSPEPVVISYLGVVPIAAWAVPKHVHVPKVLPPSGLYEIEVDFLKRLCRLDFADPLLLESGTAWRFYLRLINFSEALSQLLCNESLLTVIVSENDEYVESAPLYLGVL